MSSIHALTIHRKTLVADFENAEASEAFEFTYTFLSFIYLRPLSKHRMSAQNLHLFIQVVTYSPPFVAGSRICLYLDILWLTQVSNQAVT